MELSATVPIALPIAPRAVSPTALRLRRARQAVVERRSSPDEDSGTVAPPAHLHGPRRQQTWRTWLAATITGVAMLASVLGGWLGSAAWLVTALVLASAAAGLTLHAMLRSRQSAAGPATWQQPVERIASTGETSILRYLASKDPEIRQLIAPWWESGQPIRLRDIELVMEFCDAKRAHGSQLLAGLNQSDTGNPPLSMRPQPGCPCADGECPAWSPAGPAAATQPARCAAARENSFAPARRR